MNGDEGPRVLAAARSVAEAIGRRDAGELARWLAPDFIHRAPGGESRDARAFAEALRSIPGEIAFVRLEALAVDFAGEAALVTGIQHARVSIEGTDVDDRRAFVDCFIKRGGEWRLQVAVDLPAPETP